MLFSSKRFVHSLVPVTLLLVCALTARSQTLTAEIRGTPDPFFDNGFQITGSDPGDFISYMASAGLPQISGDDLSKFGFTLDAIEGETVGEITSYSGTFVIYAPGYGYTPDQPLETGTFTGQSGPSDNFLFDRLFTGIFNATPGTLQPAGWPIPVDFSPGFPARFTGGFAPNDFGGSDFRGTLTTFAPTAVPEPGAVALLIGLGISGVGLLARRRN